MGIAVLGPLQVDGQANGFSPRDRVVLSALVARAGEPITTGALADALWGEDLPATWAKVLQGCVVRLRKQLGSAAIVSAAHGYRLALTDEELDHKVFERLLDRAREALAAGDPARSSYLAQEALELWRGPAFPDLVEWEPGRVETTRLEGLRMDAEELLVEAETDAGRAREVLERARALVAQAPFRERRWALLARALHQSGRQPEALGAIQRARAMLVEEFGLDPGGELVALEAKLLRQDPSLSPATSREVSATCPYRGLLPYDAADADTFFGREDDIAACLRRLRDTGVLTVIGPSGVGKSSLVRAGLVASLSGSGRPVLVTTPGVHPMDSIVGLKPRGRQTLVVDQAEEAVTLCTDPAERARYFAALALHVGAGGALVLALRADHLGDLAPYPEIARVVEDGMYLLGPMSEPGLRSAIEGPARRAGLRLEPGLVDLLVREVEGEPAALPLLSHVLRETWERREGPTLTVAGYRATGGIRQAVSRSAESLYDAMDATQRSPAAQPAAPAGHAHRGRRPGPGPRPAGQGRRRRRPQPARRAAGGGAAGQRRRGHPPDRPRGARPGVAATARLARRRRRRAAAVPPPGRRRRRLGGHGASGQRALPGHPAQPHPGMAGPRHARAERHRDRLPRRLGCPGRRRAARRRDPGRPGTQVPAAAARCAGRGGPLPAYSPWSRASSPSALRTGRRRTGGTARRRPGWLRPGGPVHRQRDRRTRPPDCSSRSRHSPSMTPRRPGTPWPRC